MQNVYIDNFNSTFQSDVSRFSVSSKKPSEYNSDQGEFRKMLSKEEGLSHSPVREQKNDRLSNNNNNKPYTDIHTHKPSGDDVNSPSQATRQSVFKVFDDNVEAMTSEQEGDSEINNLVQNIKQRDNAIHVASNTDVENVKHIVENTRQEAGENLHDEDFLKTPIHVSNFEKAHIHDEDVTVLSSLSNTTQGINQSFILQKQNPQTLGDINEAGGTPQEVVASLSHKNAMYNRTEIEEQRAFEIKKNNANEGMLKSVVDNSNEQSLIELEKHSFKNLDGELKNLQKQSFLSEESVKQPEETVFSKSLLVDANQKAKQKSSEREILQIDTTEDTTSALSIFKGPSTSEIKNLETNTLNTPIKGVSPEINVSQNYIHHAQSSSFHNSQMNTQKTISHMVFQLQQQVNNGNKEFSIKLHPEQLGAVDVKMVFEKDGKVRASFKFDNDVALDYVRGNFSLLERALESVGINSDKSSMQFSLGHQGQHHEKSFAEQFISRQREASAKNNHSKDNNDLINDTEVNYKRYTLANSRIDIKV